METAGERSLDVLIADGEPSFSEAMNESLEMCEWSISATSLTSSEEVIEEGTTNSETIDGVLVGDELDGVANVIDELRNRAGLPVILLAESSRTEPVSEAVEAGATDVFPRLAEPAQCRLLLERLERKRSEGKPSRTVNSSLPEGTAESGQVYQELFENVGDGLVLHDLETGEIVDVNERFCEMNGYSRQELLGEDIGIVTAPDEEYSYEAAQSRIERARDEGPQLFEWRNQHKDGETFPVEVHLAVVQLQGTERVLGSVREITKRKHREREFREIFDSVQEIISVHDPETGDIIDVNDSHTDAFGYDRETIRDLGVEGLSLTEEGFTKERSDEIVTRVAETGESETYEWKVELGDGEHRWYEGVATPATIGGEKRVLNINRDITERKRREREYEQIFHGVQDAIVIHDPETGEMTDVNDTFCELMGYDRETILELGTAGVSVTEEGFTQERADEIIAEVMAEGHKGPFEWKVETSDGEQRLLEVTAEEAEIGGNRRHISINRDITERKRREREFEQIFHGVHGGLTINDPETGEFVRVNDSFCDLLGYDRQEVFELGIEGVSDTDRGFTVERAREIIHEIVETGEPQQYEWAAETSDGETRWLDVRGTPAEIGGEQRFLSITRDVTEQRRREREYEQIFDGVNDTIAVFHPETGEILDVNETYHEVWGYDDIETIRELGIDGLSASEKGYTGEQGRELIRDVAASGEIRTVEWLGETKDGDQLWTEAKLTPAVIGGEERVLSIQRDITGRKYRERIIRALHDTTDRFQEADSREAVCEALVDAVEDVLDLPMAACWVPADDGTEVLKPVTWSERAGKRPGGPGVIEASSSEYEVYQGDELVTRDRIDQWDQTVVEHAFLVPLGDYGLLGAAVPASESSDDVTLDAARILTRHATSALDRVERARELRESERRFRTIAERINELIYLADVETMDVLYISPSYADLWGRPVEEIYDDPTAFAEAIHPDDIESFKAAREAMFADIHGGDPDDSYDFSYRIERPDGELRWIESTGYPIVRDDDRPDRYVALIEDVTEQVRREQTLETFHEATRELTEANSRESACRRAVDAAEDVLVFPLVSIYLYDETNGELTAAAVTSRLDELDAELPAFGPGDSLPWQVFVEGDSVTSSDREMRIYGPGISGPDIVLPLGQHGVMLVGDPTETFDAENTELAQILAATLEAALNHVAGEQALERRNEELRRQQERADQLEQLNTIIRDIEQATVEHSSRTGIEEAVCERLIDVSAHDFVWIAEPTVAEDELVPTTSAGEKTSYIDSLTVGIDSGTRGHPATAAYRDDEPRVVDNVATDITSGEWRKIALRHGIQSAIALPIRYESTTHGVLVVASEHPEAFDTATEEVLVELGRSIGYAITIADREQSLESEGTTELEFTIADDGLFAVRAATTVGCRIHLERTVRRSGGSFSMFYVVENSSPDAVVELANTAQTVETAQVVSTDEHGESGLIEVTGPTWFGSVFTEHGAVVKEMIVDETEGTILVEGPRGTNVRSLVEGFQERYPDTELVAQRQREQSTRSLFELRDVLREELTDRQWEALETALSAGYFAWPRELTGEEVADLVGVSQPTFNKHLRIAEQTAFRMLLDREYPE